MDRLTTCNEITKDTDMTNQWGYSHIYKRLAEYEDLEEQGRLVRLPCKMGEECFVLRISAEEIRITSGDMCGIALAVINKDEKMIVDISNAFTTKKEAKQALKELTK